jgi:hypothetical protein
MKRRAMMNDRRHTDLNQLIKNQQVCNTLRKN